MLAWGSCGRKGRKFGREGRFERNFQIGKTFKYYFQCRRADILRELWRQVGSRHWGVSPLLGLDALVTRSQRLHAGLVSATPLALVRGSLGGTKHFAGRTWFLFECGGPASAFGNFALASKFDFLR
jgi:hypothetical protein